MRVLYAGESHGKGLVAIVEGLPAGITLNEALINSELARRQEGFGRGARMRIERDVVDILSGIKGGVTLGSPVALLVRNKDYRIEMLHKVHSPRPGHADLAGLLKYGFTDVREVLERASARTTAAMVAVGAVCRQLLTPFGIIVSSRVLSVAGETQAAKIVAKIAEAIAKQDTVGGVFQVRVAGMPVGLGSYVHPDRRLDAKLAQAVMSIPGIKGIEIGLGFGYGDVFGSQVHDEIQYRKGKGYTRASNNAGGIEGGISNGQDILVQACMKPIATLMNPLASVDIRSKKVSRAATERSDTCVVQAAGVVAEAVIAQVVAQVFLEKFGNDSLADIRAAFKAYQRRIR